MMRQRAGWVSGPPSVTAKDLHHHMMECSDAVLARGLRAYAAAVARDREYTAALFARRIAEEPSA